MSGFESPKYTMTPNDFFDEHLPDMSDAEVRVMCIMLRETFGYHRDSKRMSIRKLAKASGLSAKGAWNGAEAAIERGLLKKQLDGGITIWTVVIEDNSVVQGLTPVKRGTTPVKRGITPSIKENVKETIERKKNGADKESRQRDALFDAICEICSVDPATAGASIGTVKKALLKADPPYTPDEVKEFGRHWWADDWRNKRGEPPSIWKLKEQIGIVRNGRTNGHGRKPLADWQTDPTKAHDEYLRLNRKFLTPEQLEEAIVKGIHTR